jgi:hypothetical protein
MQGVFEAIIRFLLAEQLSIAPLFHYEQAATPTKNMEESYARGDGGRGETGKEPLMQLSFSLR